MVYGIGYVVYGIGYVVYDIGYVVYGIQTSGTKSAELEIAVSHWPFSDQFSPFGQVIQWHEFIMNK